MAESPGIRDTSAAVSVGCTPFVAVADISVESVKDITFAGKQIANNNSPNLFRETWFESKEKNVKVVLWIYKDSSTALKKIVPLGTDVDKGLADFQIELQKFNMKYKDGLNPIIFGLPALLSKILHKTNKDWKIRAEEYTNNLKKELEVRGYKMIYDRKVPS